jgi:galactokinase
VSDDEGMSVTDRAVSLHRDTFGTDPIGVWSAPGRVNLIGEHTDYNNGFVLPIAIPQRTVVAVGRNNDASIRVVSDQQTGVVELSLHAIDKTAMTGWSGYALGVVWAFNELGVEVSDKPGLTLAVSSDVPLGAGLSSSAALECAVALALNDCWDVGFDRTQLAIAGRMAENDVVGANTGMMDQMASLFATPGHALFLDCADSSTTHIPVTLGDHVIAVMDTTVSHALADSAYGARRASCEKAAATLSVDSLRELTPEVLDQSRHLLDEETFRRARHVVTENARVHSAAEALRAGDLRAFGQLLSQSHESMRDDFEISCDELDLAVSCAMEAGALGARLTGGGFGGSAIALIQQDSLPTLRTTLQDAFSARSWQVPQPVVVFAAGGASRH